MDLGQKLPLKNSVGLMVLNVIFQQQQKITKKKIPFKEDKQERNFCQMLQQIVVLSTNVIKFIHISIILQS